MKSTLAILAAALLAAGCAPAATWRNPGLPPQAATQRFGIDSEECRARAAAATSAPAADSPVMRTCMFQRGWQLAQPG